MRSYKDAIIIVVLILSAYSCKNCSEKADYHEKMIEYNTAADLSILDPEEIDSLLAMQRTQMHTTSERIGLWARLFLSHSEIQYLNGLEEGGYVSEGVLLSDRRQDCVYFVYRCCELAHAIDHRHAIELAFYRRFPNAPIELAIDNNGRANYNRPEHLDFSMDMVSSGLWGDNITSEFAGAQLYINISGSCSRKEFIFVPKESLDPELLNEGDIAWFVLDTPLTGYLGRCVYIGHIGIISKDADGTHIIHATNSNLKGIYKGGRIAKAPILKYLEATSIFCGVVVTRFKQASKDDGNGSNK